MKRLGMNKLFKLNKTDSTPNFPKKIATPGLLSVFPEAKDSFLNLHKATNKTQDTLKQTLPANGKYLILNDSNSFPDSGIIKITPVNSDTLLKSFEVIFYGKKIGNQLHLLQRGYNNSAINNWPAGSKVTCPLMAEHHNAIKDAIVRIQRKIGLSENPTEDSVHGILNYIEKKWFTPKPLFRAYPRAGQSPLTVTFHNFSVGYNLRYLWDFGDGGTSSEPNPIHKYENEGNYTIRLTMISANGAQGLTEKSDYVSINNSELPAFFYVNPMQGIAGETEFSFVDQSDGDIVERHWFFGDDTDLTISNPNIHEITHKYDKAGTFLPSLIIRLANNNITKRVFLPEGIEIV